MLILVARQSLEAEIKLFVSLGQKMTEVQELQKQTPLKEEKSSDLLESNAFSYLHRDDFTPPVRKLADNIHEQIQTTYQNHGVKNLDEFKDLVSRGKVDAEETGQLKELMRRLGHVVETGMDPLKKVPWKSYEETMKFDGQRGEVNNLLVLPDGKIASGSFHERAFYIWDSETGKSIDRIETANSSSRLISLAFFPDGRLVSGNADGVIHTWDLGNRAKLKNFLNRGGWVNTLAILNGNKIVAGNTSGAVRIWNYETEEVIKELKGYEKSVSSIAILPNGRIAFSGDSIHIWDPKKEEEIIEVKEWTDHIYSLDVFPNGNIVSGSKDGTICIWNSNNGEKLKELKGNNGEVRTVAVISNGDIISGHEDGTVCIWGFESQQVIKKIKGHEDPVNAIVITPDDRIISGDDKGNILMWGIKK